MLGKSTGLSTIWNQNMQRLLNSTHWFCQIGGQLNKGGIVGTRAIVVIEDAGNAVASIYRQWDGYSLGEELYKKFRQIEIVRGNSSEFEMGKHAVGMGCFAAQVVEFLKSKVGEIYLVPFDKDDETSNDINVFIRLTEGNGKVVIMEKRKGRLYYSGKLEDYPVDGVMDRESLMKIIEALPEEEE